MELPDGWDLIPGARGCTPQRCAFRDHHAELAALVAEDGLVTRVFYPVFPPDRNAADVVEHLRLQG